ncbi:hypothetical protein HK102_009717, partial [Quaeritorhiza haematococci]
MENYIETGDPSLRIDRLKQIYLPLKDKILKKNPTDRTRAVHILTYLATSPSTSASLFSLLASELQSHPPSPITPPTPPSPTTNSKDVKRRKLAAALFVEHFLKLKEKDSVGEDMLVHVLDALVDCVDVDGFNPESSDPESKG